MSSRRLSIPCFLVVCGIVLFVVDAPQWAEAQAPSWTLVWSDEFSGHANTGVDAGSWVYDIGTQYVGGSANWGTGEVESMSNSTAIDQDGAGHLVINPIHVGSSPTGGWTSGRIETRMVFAAPVNGALAVEASIQQPNVSGSAAAGYWPAFWMLGAAFRGNYFNWPSVGEIDMMEDINGLNSIFATLHCGTSPGGPCNEPRGLGSGEKACVGCQTVFHIYRVEVDRSVSPEEIRWYLDGAILFTVNSSQVDAATWANAVDHAFFIIFDVAMGGSFPAAFGGGPTASTESGIPMLVDYVRVYQKPIASPLITTQPQSQTIISGSTATLSVTASGTAPLGYQWYVGTTGTTTSPIAGATLSSYTTPALTSTTSYWVQVSAAGGNANSTTATVLVAIVPGDFDGNGKTDPAVYRPSNGTWYILHSRTNYTTSSAVSWGVSTDNPVRGDFDGDGKSDPAVYRPSTGMWYILESSTNYTTSSVVSWGVSTDIPVPADYDGDGKVDPAVYRPSTGQWFALLSSTDYTTNLVHAWGVSTDVAVQGDYDGDGKADPAVYRPSTGQWYILTSSSNYTMNMQFTWGVSTDVPVQGDYDGDGLTDPAVYRPTTGQWFALRSSTDYTTSILQAWGVSTDIPVPGDYDGDGLIDPAVFRPSTGLWYIMKSSTNYTTFLAVPWGVGTDIPVLKRP